MTVGSVRTDLTRTTSQHYVLFTPIFAVKTQKLVALLFDVAKHTSRYLRWSKECLLYVGTTAITARKISGTILSISGRIGLIIMFVLFKVLPVIILTFLDPTSI